MAVKGSNGAGALDTRLLREEATSITDAVSRIVQDHRPGVAGC